MNEAQRSAMEQDFKRYVAKIDSEKKIIDGKAVIPPKHFENIPEPVEFAEGTKPEIRLDEIKIEGKKFDEDIKGIQQGLRKAEVIAKEEQIAAKKAQKLREEKTGIMELSEVDLLPVTKADRDKLAQDEFDTAMLLDSRGKEPPMFNVPGKGRVTLPKRKI